MLQNRLLSRAPPNECILSEGFIYIYGEREAVILIVNVVFGFCDIFHLQLY